eukprot:365272-Chlamydomonas_euryale.AAC.14
MLCLVLLAHGSQLAAQLLVSNSKMLQAMLRRHKGCTGPLGVELPMDLVTVCDPSPRGGACRHASMARVDGRHPSGCEWTRWHQAGDVRWADGGRASGRRRALNACGGAGRVRRSLARSPIGFDNRLRRHGERMPPEKHMERPQSASGQRAPPGLRARPLQAHCHTLLTRRGNIFARRPASRRT